MTFIERVFQESEEERKLSVDPDTIVPPDIITKQQLESKSRPRGPRRDSTDEEETVKTEEPHGSDTKPDDNKKK